MKNTSNEHCWEQYLKVAVKKAQAKQGKVYVGKLKAELSDEEIKTHFEQFGQIAQVCSQR